MAAKKQTRYGIGEWYGRDFSSLSPDMVRQLAEARASQVDCRFRGGKCNKKGGVCSLRVYERDGETVKPLTGPVTTCPQRFKESDRALTWIAKTLIGTESPAIIREVPFLKSTATGEGEPDAVGQVDMVLVNQDGPMLSWCCVEMQAVYFSGPGMEAEFAALSTWHGPGLPFPQKVRRPDFRSSGPKRLMPQLQTKVPTISRWGKKMAVLIDRAFWHSLSPMTEAVHMSNADVAWFVVDYRMADGLWELAPAEVHYTTLDHAVEGLTGGVPVSLHEFELTLTQRLNRPK